jgi:hypothetical protein
MNTSIPKRVVHTRRDTDIVNYNIEALKKKRDRKLKEARKTGNPQVLMIVKELDKAIKDTIKTTILSTVKATNI